MYSFQLFFSFPQDFVLRESSTLSMAQEPTANLPPIEARSILKKRIFSLDSSVPISSLTEYPANAWVSLLGNPSYVSFVFKQTLSQPFIGPFGSRAVFHQIFHYYLHAGPWRFGRIKGIGLAPFVFRRGMVPSLGKLC